jgi:DNA-binding transcriptional regulator PaaX
MSRRKEISKDILTVLSALGLVTVSVVAPNIGKIILLFLNKNENKYYNQNAKRSIKTLTKNNFVKKWRHQGTVTYALTDKGVHKLEEYRLADEIVVKPEIWDRKWRVVVFDIPNTKNLKRKILVRYLKKWELLKLQKSVWIHPYNCEVQLNKVSEFYGINKYLIILVVTRIDLNIEKKLKRHFKL